MKIYVIYDRRARAVVGGLHIMKHDEVARRMYTDMANDRNTIIGMHPMDYDLMSNGSFSEETGLITATKKMQPVLTGQQWIESQRTPSAEAL